MPRPHTGTTEHMVGSVPGCPGCEDYLAREPLARRIVTTLRGLWTSTWMPAKPLDEEEEPRPDDALSIITDAALEFAQVLDARTKFTRDEVERNRAATWAMEIRDAVALIDRRTS